jgi:hypothetical protein
LVAWFVANDVQIPGEFVDALGGGDVETLDDAAAATAICSTAAGLA